MNETEMFREFFRQHDDVVSHALLVFRFTEEEIGRQHDAQHIVKKPYHDAWVWTGPTP